MRQIRLTQSTMTLWHQKKNTAQWSLLSDMSWGEQGHQDTVYDISWSLLNGRSFHYIVSCGKEGIFVWKLKIGVNSTVELLDLKKFTPEFATVPVCATWNWAVGLA